MRVLLTVDAVGGVWQYGLDLAQALSTRDVDPVLALLGPAPDAGQRSELRARGLRLIETGLPLDWLCDGPTPVLNAGAVITDLARQERADLLQLNMPTLAAAGPPPLPVIAVTHGCVSTWWQAARPSEPLDPGLRWHHGLMAEGLRAADRVVAPSAGYARIVARQYGLSRQPDAVHNGRVPLVMPGSAPAPDRVLTVGRLWDSVKRAALLDRVAERLSVPFLAAGAARGPHGETVALGNLHQLGQLDRADLADQLAQRPVFVSAASFEPFGLAVLEAAAAGCPLVLSDIPTFRELWDGAALFVPGDDETAYVQAIEQLLGDDALRLQIGSAAHERSRRYTPAAMAEGMLAQYRHAIGARISHGSVAA